MNDFSSGSSPSSSGGESGFGRGGWFMVAAGFVVVLLAGLLVVGAVNLFSGFKTDDSASATTSMSASASDAGAAGDTNESVDASLSNGCPDFPVSADTTLSQGPVVDWDLVFGMAVPVSDSTGPGLVDEDGWRHCYAQTPAGALVAAVNLFAQMQDPESFARLVDKGVQPGPFRDLTLRQLDEGLDVSELGQGYTYQIIGFKLDAFTGEAATVSLLMRSPGYSQYFTCVTDLVWLDGDWVYAVKGEGEDQTIGFTFNVVPSPVGYVDWQAE